MLICGWFQINFYNLLCSSVDPVMTCNSLTLNLLSINQLIPALQLRMTCMSWYYLCLFENDKQVCDFFFVTIFDEYFIFILSCALMISDGNDNFFIVLYLYFNNTNDFETENENR